MEGIPLLAEKGELQSAVLERKRIESSLSSAGGRREVLLAMCSDLADMIDEIEEVTGKKQKMEHAAFGTKVKFSRKMRRKAKDLRNFEGEIVRQFDQGGISVEHGRKMAKIVGLMKSGDAGKARQEAREFYGLLGNASRLGEIEEKISDAAVRVARARRAISAKLSDLEWLEGQIAIDESRIARCNERMQLKQKLGERRLEAIRALRFMPIEGILGMIRGKGTPPGFPILSEGKNAALTGYLQASSLLQKPCAQLLELVAASDQKLARLGLDVPSFRREIGGRERFLSQVSFLNSEDFLPVDDTRTRQYLSSQSGEAKGVVERLEALEKTSDEDERELQRREMMDLKRKGLEGAKKEELEVSLQELSELEAVLEGKAAPEKIQTGQKKEEGGLMGILKGFFR